ncbi:PITH domain-containing protein [Platanthera guangdongensis]|uniref:PITH domain-containing protein n=1 Tax=Platanthera guangdongensis TaxID=2320717 RepID=A0ABR2M2S1_9ASPA
MASVIHRSQVDLVDFVDWRGVEFLNQKSGHAIDNAPKQGYREDDGLHLESGADEHILICIPFTQVVKLHSIVIKGPDEEGYVKFQNVRSLTIFIKYNQGGNYISKVQKIALYGTTARFGVEIGHRRSYPGPS